MSWTLEYFPVTGASVTRTLEAWGILADLPYQFSSQATSVLHIITTNDFDDAFQWDYGQPAIVRNGETIFFQGFVDAPRKIMQGGRQNHRYTLVDAWSLLEEHGYQQSRQSFIGWLDGETGGTPLTETLFTSEVCLAEAENGVTRIDSGAQIAAVIGWLNECYNPTRRGGTTPDAAQDVIRAGAIGVAVPVPKYPVRDQVCAEAIRQMLQWSQDAVVHLDHSTTPPTLHITRSVNMATLTATLTESRATSVDLQPRYDRQLPGVVIRYKKNYTVDGHTGLQIVTDSYPAGITGYTPGIRPHTIDLIPAEKSTESVTFQTTLVTPNAVALADRIAWWKKHEVSLADPNITIHELTTAVSVKDEEDKSVSLAAWPYELLGGGSVPEWTGVATKRVTITATVKLTKTRTGASQFIQEKQDGKQVHVRLVLCDKPGGTFSRTTYLDPGEEVPEGLAQSLYESMQDLQWEGSVTLQEDEAPAGLALGKKLTIATPDATYGPSIVQAISGELTRNAVTVQLGPPGHIGLTDMIELLRVNRSRFIYRLHREDAMLAAGQSSTDLSGETAKENSGQSVGDKTEFAVADTVNSVLHAFQAKPASGTVALGQQASDGDSYALNKAQAYALIELAKLVEGEGLEIREEFFQDPSKNCKWFRRKIWSTEPVETTKPT